jgi:type II secretory pathway component PulC
MIDKLKMLQQHPQYILSLSGICCIITFWVMIQTLLHPHAFVEPFLHASEHFSHHDALQAKQLDNIVNQHLFGEGLSANAIKQTHLQISLVGILMSSNPKKSQAIMATPDGKQTVYQIGATLPGGAILKSIQTDRILLERNNQLEALSLPRNMLHFEPASKGLTLPETEN